MPAISTLTGDFTNSAVWTKGTGFSTAKAATRLDFLNAIGVTSTVSTFGWDLTGSTFSWKIPEIAGTLDFGIELHDSGGNYYRWASMPNAPHTWAFMKNAATVGTITDAVARANPYQRYRETGGTTYIDGSPDGVNWTPFTGLNTVNMSTIANFQVTLVPVASSILTDNCTIQEINGTPAPSQTVLQRIATSVVNAGAWGTPTNVLGNDSAVATSTGATLNTEYPIDVAGFDFSAIPAGSIINAIRVTAVARTAVTSRSNWKMEAFDGATSLGTTALAAYKSTTDTPHRLNATATLAQLKSAGFLIRFTDKRINATANTSSLNSILVAVDYTPPATALIATMVDKFDTIATPPWSIWSGGVTAPSGQLTILPTSQNTTYRGLNRTDLFILRGSQVFIETVSVGNQALTSFEATPLGLINYAQNTHVQYVISGNNLNVHITGPGTVFSMAYDAVAMRWVSIRETGGTVYFETSPTGAAGSWTVRYSMATSALPAAFDPDNVVYQMSAGTWQSEAGTTTAMVVDNLNNPPASTGGNGSATGTITFAGTVSGKRTPKATASGAFTDVGSASGKETPKATVAGAISWVGSATGKRVPKAAPTGAFTMVGAAVGKEAPKAAVAGAVSWSGSASGKATPKASATGALTWVGSATGKATPKAAATGALTWIGSAAGTKPTVGVKAGNATGLIVWSGSARGIVPAQGTAIGSVIWTGSASGAKPLRGSAPGAIAFTGSATGRRVPKANPGGTITWVGAGVGRRTAKATITGAIVWSGAVAGHCLPVGLAVGDLVWTATAVGKTPIPLDLTRPLMVDRSAELDVDHVDTEFAAAGRVLAEFTGTGTHAVFAGTGTAAGFSGPVRTAEFIERG